MKHHSIPVDNPLDSPDPTMKTPGAKMWAELDAVVDRLKDLSSEDMLGDRARADGMCTIIAIYTSPISPNPETIRAIAMERWEKRQG